MVKTIYIPGKGDLIWINFDPRMGREQRGRRPALVMSAKFYNKLAGLALVCSVTSQVKGYPFEVVLSGSKVSGAVLADHIHSLDWKKRRAAFIQKANFEIVENVYHKILVLAGREV